MYYGGCKDCSKRVLGCHATCETYINYKKELENYVDKLKKQKFLKEEFDEDLFAAMIENIIINKENIMIITKDGWQVEI